MHPLAERLLQTRRDFLATSANGVGLLALALRCSKAKVYSRAEDANPLVPRKPHFAPEGEELHLHLPRRAHRRNWTSSTPNRS